MVRLKKSTLSFDCSGFSLGTLLSTELISEPLLKGMIGTVDLLIKTGCLVKKEEYSSSMEISSSELVSTRWLTVLILLPLL
jgi:hypothetical protein